MALNKQNLVPITSTEQARELGRKGGIASAKAKKQKKTISAMYQAFLDGTYIIDGKEMTAEELIIQSVVKNVKRGGVTSVSQMKEVREATEIQEQTAPITVVINKSYE